MTDELGPSCGNCRFWLPHLRVDCERELALRGHDRPYNECGVCRAGAPSTTAGWPTTHQSEWCGAWVNRNPPCGFCHDTGVSSIYEGVSETFYHFCACPRGERLRQGQEARDRALSESASSDTAPTADAQSTSAPPRQDSAKPRPAPRRRSADP